MSKDATINARVDKKLKARAELVLDRVGVRTSDLITMLLHQVVLHDGIPFDVKIPTKDAKPEKADKKWVVESVSRVDFDKASGISIYAFFFSRPECEAPVFHMEAITAES